VSCNSDQRLKQNIEPLTGALDKLLQLKGVTFEWKNPEDHGDHKGTQTGVIAQEVEKVFPQWVRETEKGVKNVDPDARTMVALTVEGFRELKAQNDELRLRVQSLEAGRRPMISGIGEGGVGLGLIAVAGAVLISRRRRSELAD
jgi:Chaperone of endosialidase